MSSPARHSRIEALLAWTGAIGLSTSVLVGTASVLARRLGIALAGDVEIMRAAILVTASVALLCATLASRHARVHLLTDRLPVTVGMPLARTGALLSAVFFLAVACGLAWIMLDLRHAHEQSDILHIPYAPLRWINLAAVLGALVATAIRGWRRQRS